MERAFRFAVFSHVPARTLSKKAYQSYIRWTAGLTQVSFFSVANHDMTLDSAKNAVADRYWEKESDGHDTMYNVKESQCQVIEFINHS